MHTFAYTQTTDSDPAAMRAQEREAFETSIALLQAAAERGPQSREAREALAYLSRLWTFLIGDLSRPGNDLPEELRDTLIRLGLATLHEIARIDRGESRNFALLIDISRSMVAGLS